MAHRGTEFLAFYRWALFPLSGGSGTTVGGGSSLAGSTFSSVQDKGFQAGAYLRNDEPTEIIARLWTSGSIPRKTEYEIGDLNLVTGAADGSECPDRFEDETSLFYAGPRGLVVISGCAHSGLVNTVQWGLEVTGASRLAGWIGGTHLGPVSKEQQDKTLAKLVSFAPDFVAANHCTGFAMMATLHDRFGERFIPAFVSTVIDV